MIRTSFFAALTVAATLLSVVSYGQAWEKSTKVLSLGLGASSFFQFGSYAEDGEASRARWGAPISGQLNFQGEFGVHEYVGVGFTTGVGGAAPIGFGRFGGYTYYNGSVNFPIGAIANFHFYQLIADKTGKDIHADKLDIYGGVSLGSGIAALFYDYGGTKISALIFGGPHVGARYYFKEKFGVNLELGYGKSIVNGGIVFKL